MTTRGNSRYLDKIHSRPDFWDDEDKQLLGYSSIPSKYDEEFKEVSSVQKSEPLEEQRAVLPYHPSPITDETKYQATIRAFDRGFSAHQITHWFGISSSTIRRYTEIYELKNGKPATCQCGRLWNHKEMCEQRKLHKPDKLQPREFDSEETRNLCVLYKNGKSLSALSRHFNTTDACIKGVLKKNGTKLRKAPKFNRNGASKVPARVYSVWWAMIRKCHYSEPGSIAYHYYRSRGITVCERWRNSIQAFYEDMGDRPLDTTIDRIDGNGNYEPSNCRWASKTEQRLNQKSTVNREAVVELLKKGLRSVDIRNKLGYSAPTITQIAKYNGFDLVKTANENRSPRSDAKFRDQAIIEQVRELRVGGMSIKSISGHTKIGEHTVGRIVRELGISLHPRSPKQVIEVNPPTTINH